MLGCYDHDLNTDRKRRFFTLSEDTEVLKEGIRSGLFSAAYQNGDIVCLLPGCGGLAVGG